MNHKEVSRLHQEHDEHQASCPTCVRALGFSECPIRLQKWNAYYAALTSMPEPPCYECGRSCACPPQTPPEWE